MPERDAEHHGLLAHHSLDDFTSEDEAMQTCLELARVASRTDLPILILGESGTGKTLLARAIHNSSGRAANPFVSFNAAALSDTLLDSQLFGHEKGAFTGALKRVKGKFELAHLGTLFIDEIADMSSVAQAKILRAVEYGEFERLGSEILQLADVRLMSATHLPLQRFIESDHFRKDLFYRISGITISVPPLRSRPRDLRLLVAAEIASASERQRKAIIGLSKRAAELLFSHRWPGNLRELKRVLHSAVAMSSGDTIQPEAIILETADTPLLATAVKESDAARNTDSALEPTAGDQEWTLKAVEQRHLRKVLEMTRGNKRLAARVLGLARSTLDRKLSSRDLQKGELRVETRNEADGLGSRP